MSGFDVLLCESACLVYQACSMRYFYFFLLVVLSWVSFIPSTHELQTYQTQVLLQLRKHLEFPSSLEIWENYNGDFCNLSSSAYVSITCQDNSVTELKIMGDKLVKVREFNGFSIPNQTLSMSFSIDSFVTTLASTIPDFFASLPNLNTLSLKSNRLKGQFPSSICTIKTLTYIALSHNELSGRLPDLSALTGLHVLDLRENHLDLELPVMPKGLVTALLSKNSFSGEIPGKLGELSQLQHLDLSSNHLNGIPPSTLFSLPNISYLNLAYNMLSGSLSDQLSCGGKLGFVDICANKLTGGLPSCLANTSEKRVVKFEGNCLSLDSQLQHRGSYCKEASTARKKLRAWEIVVVISGAALLIMLLVSGVFLCKRYDSRKNFERQQLILPKIVQDNSTTGFSSEVLANARLISQAMKLGTQAASVCRLFSIEELKEFTNNFELSMFIGEGSIGKLYKGRLENGVYVAIRSIPLRKKCSVQNLKVQLDLLSKFHHPHLVGLLGYCIYGGGQDDSSAYKVHLVYEYVPNGNYQAQLSENFPEKVLKWSDRLAILIGVAKAVHFLHTGVIPGCFSNQLKTNNILLDEHRIAKLSDYGMSIIAEEIETPEAKGDGPKSSHKTKFEDDVHNFGFILLESLVGPITSGKGEAFLLNEMASFSSQDSRRQIVDPVVLTTCSQESLSIAISITTKCISPEPSSRPSFEDVLWNLQYACSSPGHS
ncbi:Tyrosine-protein kinase [Quillaja saponaria]|uniref:Tyrosine-protein kinase n=1 Tax=Quillaja saponaria TaxID=32244 RepID=A0AAD7Q4S3_QUISA|nr:Tyrosine-protein kinase [Quillaja saponaria]